MEQLYLVDILADYYAMTVEELWAGYLAKAVEEPQTDYFAALVLAGEQPSSINRLVGYFDMEVGFQVVARSGTIVEEYVDCSVTIVEGQSRADYLAKAGMY